MLVVKNPPANAGDPGDSIPGSGRSPGGGNGNPAQYSCLENPRTEKPGGLLSTGLQRARQGWTHTQYVSSLNIRQVFSQSNEDFEVISNLIIQFVNWSVVLSSFVSLLEFWLLSLRIYFAKRPERKGERLYSL